MNSNAADSSSPEKRVQLPEPDMDNITVLTRELPNEPILPWHHYDSPWLEGEVPAETEVQPEEEIQDEDALATGEPQSTEPQPEAEGTDEAIALPDLATLDVRQMDDVNGTHTPTNGISDLVRPLIDPEADGQDELSSGSFERSKEATTAQLDPEGEESADSPSAPAHETSDPQPNVGDENPLDNFTTQS